LNFLGPTVLPDAPDGRDTSVAGTAALAFLDRRLRPAIR